MPAKLGWNQAPNAADVYRPENLSECVIFIVLCPIKLTLRQRQYGIIHILGLYGLVLHLYAKQIIRYRQPRKMAR